MSRESRVEARLQTYGELLAPEAWDQRFTGLEAMEKVEMELLLRFTQGLDARHPRKVLDLGCGTGRMAMFFAQDTYLGIDRSVSFVRYCHDRRRDDAAFLLADMDALPFKPGAFDVVLVVGTLESETHPGARVENLLRYLCPGGRLVFTLQNQRNLPGWLSSALSRRYKQTFWARGEVVRMLDGRQVSYQMATCYLVPPGLLRVLVRTLHWRAAQQWLMARWIALERINIRYELNLGYQWIVAVTRPLSPGEGEGTAK